MRVPRDWCLDPLIAAHGLCLHSLSLCLHSLDYVTGVPRGEKALGYVSASFILLSHLSVCICDGAHYMDFLCSLCSTGQHLQWQEHGLHCKLHWTAGENPTDMYREGQADRKVETQTSLTYGQMD